jgi:3-deoxy-manno-octulosonate cytidylyltransferase (CMP-KDO synthetase)
MAVVAIIPARYGSTRLPGKPLAPIGGKPMIQHVYESTSKARGLDRVLVATDDRRIAEAVRDFGGEVVMTSKNHASGTDRLAEVARKIKADWVVNVQGDLPFIQPATITCAVQPMRRSRSIPMGTVCTPIDDEAEWRNPNIVKVIRDARGFAIYFSRATIPFARNDISQAEDSRPLFHSPPSRGKHRGGKDNGARHPKKIWGHRHVGLYVYRRDFLLKFARLRPTLLEQAESLEQLRALVYGHRIFVADVDEHSVEVDTPEDLVKAEEYLRQVRN